MVVGGPRRKSGNGTKNALRAAVIVISLLMILSTVSMASMAGPTQKDYALERGDHVPGELLVKWKDEASEDAKKGAKGAVKAKDIKTFKIVDIDHWKLGKDMTVEKAMKELGKDKYKDVVEFAEPNYYCYVDTVPTDTYRGDLWNFHNVGQDGGTMDADIDAMEVWDTLVLGDEVVVAVLDTGVDYNHPDLDGVMWTNPGETAGNGIDDDGNGFIDDVYGWDFRNGDNDPIDDNGHGSHCAGVIAAEHDGSGVLGVAASSVKIMAVKWLCGFGCGKLADALDAIEYAASFEDADGDKVVKITSNSWRISKSSKTLEKAIKSSGALFVASAGNSASSNIQYPAGYGLDNIISVAATDHSDNLASFSNYGSSWVDLGAPGVDIFSCDLDKGYTWKSGTSMSAPHVAGAAAMVWSKSSGNTIAQTKAAILDNVEAESALSGKVGSNGKLNVRIIFDKSELGGDTTAPGQITLSSTAHGMDSATLGWTSVGDDGSTGSAYLYDVRYDDCVSTSFSWSLADTASIEPFPQAPGNTESHEVKNLKPGTTYTFAIKAVDECGNGGTASNLVQVMLDAPKWIIDDTVDTSATDVFYQSMAIDGSGNPAFAYAHSDTTYFAYKDANGDWQQEDIGASSSGGLDLTHDGNTWWVVLGGRSVRVAERNGADSWSVTSIVDRRVNYRWKTIETFSSTQIGISYMATGRNGGLSYAEFDGTSWTTELVDKGALADYNALAFDSNGNPGIAYSDTNDNQWINVLKYAHRSSSGTWTIETLLEGAMGHGIHPDIEFDSSDNPHIVCPGGGINYLHWDGTEWQYDFADDYDWCGAPSLVLVDDDIYVGFDGETQTYVSKWDGTSWDPEVVEPTRSGTWLTRLEYDAGSETLHFGYIYEGTQDLLHHAIRDISTTGPVWG